MRGPGPGHEVDVAGREPRQADRRQQRAHRQIFAVGDEMRLVVAAEDAGRAAQARRRCWSRHRRCARRSRSRRGRRSAARRRRPSVRVARSRSVSVCASAPRSRSSSSGSVTAASGQKSRRVTGGPSDRQAVERARGHFFEAGRHLSCWPMLGWTMRIGLTVVDPSGIRAVGTAQSKQEQSGKARWRPCSRAWRAATALRQSGRQSPTSRRCRQGRWRLSRGVSASVDADRIPGEAGEHAGAEPFGDRPAAGQREDERQGACPRPSFHAKPGGEHRIDGEVERQQHNRDPAEPGRHRRLEGEGGRDPVEADGELADAEPPADQQARGAGVGARAMSSHKAAKASGISGHQPTGWKAKAEAAPRTRAIRKCIAQRAQRVDGVSDGRYDRTADQPAATLTRHTLLPTSSATSSEPSRAIWTPTGRP